MAGWRKLFTWLLNVRWVNDVRQTNIHTAEPLRPEPSAFEVEMANEHLKRHKLPGTDKITAESIKAGGKTIRPAIRNLLILFKISRNFLRNVRSRSLSLFVIRVIKQASNYRGISLLSTRCKISSNILLSRLTPHARVTSHAE